MTDDKTDTPLQRSIQHWTRLTQVKTLEGFKAEGIYANSCSLCAVFEEITDDDGIDCAGCPVRLKTGQPNCSGTPWRNVRNAMADCIEDESPENLEANRATLISAAEEELAFLKSLPEPPEYPRDWLVDDEEIQ